MGLSPLRRGEPHPYVNVGLCSLGPMPSLSWKTDPKVLLMDRLANWSITLGGLSVIAAVLGIFVFIFLTVLPLFRTAAVSPDHPLGPFAGQAPLSLARVDEHQEKAILSFLDGRVLCVDLASGAVSTAAQALIGKAHVLSAAQADLGELQALGLDDGRAWLDDAGFETRFVGDEQRLMIPYVKDGGLFLLDPHRRPLLKIAVSGKDGRSVLAAKLGPLLGVQALASFDGKRWKGKSLPFEVSDANGEIRALLVHSSGERVLVGTAKGRLLDYRLVAGRLTLAYAVDALPEGEAIGALAYTIGEQSVVVGGEHGTVQSLTLLEKGDGSDYKLVHAFEPMGAAVSAFTVSLRDRTFVALDAAGAMRAYFLTSERTLFDARLPEGLTATSLRLSPKGDGLLGLSAEGRGELFKVRNPHPEISWQTLFGKVWYEGYDKPEYVWQSTGGSDDFESKFSLTPLIYGTIKGTFYALLFAVPLAIFAALYTSQFMSRKLRAVVKPVVELMAALPSVVLGFLAALLVAPMIETHLFTVILGILGLPFFALLSLLAWRGLPKSLTLKVPEDGELFVILGGLAVGLLVVGLLGRPLESLLFNDFKVWMANQLHINYDQRNSLVVGFAMGFAVIPIIFTIAEDALSSVPRHLVSASLSAGATNWQTAFQVVLPVALSGIFSAVMVGFGRAVGETMIVLMATGNTAVMDPSPFNGFRALSANIAVEIPEAPVDGTLYRVLFLAALLLFLVTFVVNTAAELVRLHLRRKYSQL